MRRCPVCNEMRNDDDIDFCDHRFAICRFCCVASGHNEELADIPDQAIRAGDHDHTEADRLADRYERWLGL